MGVKLDTSIKGRSAGDLHMDADVKLEGPKLGSASSPKGGAKAQKEEGGGHFGFGIKVPKFGGKDSSSSEDDSTGKRVKKIKGGAKIEANVSVPKMAVTAPHADAKTGGGVDLHVKGGASVDAGGKGGFGIKMPKFGKGSHSSSSSSSEDDGHGNKVKKVKGGVSVSGKIPEPKVEAKASIPKADLSIGGKVDSPKLGVKTGVKGGMQRTCVGGG